MRTKSMMTLRELGRVVLVAAGLTLLLSACGGDGRNGSAGTGEEDEGPALLPDDAPMAEDEGDTCLADEPCEKDDELAPPQSEELELQAEFPEELERSGEVEEDASDDEQDSEEIGEQDAAPGEPIEPCPETP